MKRNAVGGVCEFSAELAGGTVVANRRILNESDHLLQPIGQHDRVGRRDDQGARRRGVGLGPGQGNSQRALGALDRSMQVEGQREVARGRFGQPQIDRIVAAAAEIVVLDRSDSDRCRPIASR